MRKKAFLKAVSLFVCLSILMLSVPVVIAYEKPKYEDNFIRVLRNNLTRFVSIFPISIVKSKVNKSDTSSDRTSDNDSDKEIKITGGKLVKKVVGDR